MVKEKTKHISFRVTEQEYDSIQKYIENNNLKHRRSQIILEALENYGVL